MLWGSFAKSLLHPEVDQFFDTGSDEEINDLNAILTLARGSRCSRTRHFGLTFPHRRFDFDPLMVIFDLGGIRKD